MKNLIIVGLIGMLIGCKEQVSLPNVNEADWIRDEKGCTGLRIQQLTRMEEDRKLLKGLNQDEIIAVLGRPDQNELYKRNQKFFIYSITPHNCSEAADSLPRTYLSIRFNATGLAKEVVIYTE